MNPNRYPKKTLRSPITRREPTFVPVKVEELPVVPLELGRVSLTSNIFQLTSSISQFGSLR